MAAPSKKGAPAYIVAPGRTIHTEAGEFGPGVAGELDREDAGRLMAIGFILPAEAKAASAEETEV